MTAEKNQSGIKAIALGRSDVFRLDPRDIHIKDGWNSREDTPELDEHIDMLARSISVEGVKEPLTVWWEEGKAYVSDGHCRIRGTWRAIEHYGADIKSVPVKTEDRYSSDADRLFSQIVRNSGKPLTPFEQGKVFKRLLAFGWTEKDISEKAGITPKRVSQVMSLMAAPQEVHEMVRSGEVSSSLAIKQVQSEEPKQAVENLKAAVQTAKDAGKTRATAKHLPATAKQRQPRATMREELHDLIDGATVIVGDDPEFVKLMFTKAEHERLLKLAGL